MSTSLFCESIFIFFFNWNLAAPSGYCFYRKWFISFYAHKQVTRWGEAVGIFVLHFCFHKLLLPSPLNAPVFLNLSSTAVTAATNGHAGTHVTCTIISNLRSKMKPLSGRVGCIVELKMSMALGLERHGKGILHSVCIYWWNVHKTSSDSSCFLT
jgi:hypothetical protein